MEKSVESKPNQRKYWCNIRLTEQEFALLHGKLQTTTCRKISEYVRNVLFDKPITVRQRNQSLDDLMTVLILYRNDLNSLGNNFNQVVKRINSVPPGPEFFTWLPVAENLQKELLSKIGSFQERIDQLGEQWLGK
ncbi:plasmid mobilization relaxosome protein MobC [uncultured Chitinophaga sp.]|uniref:plasmid mobilization protein n=1 Tax=uncultured Chitinophaga sp. TaxID=339340 RepID=UPI00263974FF|nr:plasmid mobilization relaxosome protein MobC [uncultured Chitinophaga sp.]